MRRFGIAAVLAIASVGTSTAAAQQFPDPTPIPTTGTVGFDPTTMTGFLTPDLSSAGLLVTGGGTLADIDVMSGWAAPDAQMSFHALGLAAPSALPAWSQDPSYGCPTDAPVGTLRSRSVPIDIFDVCSRSVRAARHRYAADAIKFALNQLGAPYSQTRRMNDGVFDCSSLVMRAYHHSGLDVLIDGNAPTTHRLLPHSWGQAVNWSIPVEPDQVRPGDLVFLEPEDGTGHVAMVLADGWLVHTATTGDVVHVRPQFANPYAFRAIDPTAV